MHFAFVHWFMFSQHMWSLTRTIKLLEQARAGFGFRSTSTYQDMCWIFNISNTRVKRGIFESNGQRKNTGFFKFSLFSDRPTLLVLKKTRPKENLIGLARLPHRLNAGCFHATLKASRTAFKCFKHPKNHFLLRRVKIGTHWLNFSEIVRKKHT